MKTTIAALAALLLLPTAAQAAAPCRTSDLGGTWLVAMTGDVSCVVEISTAGNVSRGNCYVLPSYFAIGTLSGFFQAKKSCEVSGSIIQINGSRRVEASFKGDLEKKGKQTLSGVAKSKETKVGFFAIRQW